MSDRPSTHEHDDPGRPLPEALDALVESGFEPETGDREQQALSRLLGLLDVPPADAPQRDLLINVTVARVARHRADEHRLASLAPDSSDDPLTAESAGALDAYANDGWTAEASDERAARAERLLSALDIPGGVTPEERDSLVGRTLGVIQDQIEENQNRFRMSPTRDLHAARPRITLSDLTAVAAMVMIAGAIIWPLITGLREASHERLCAQDLSNAGVAFAMYANDHNDRLPSRESFAMAQADAREREANRPWWSVGESSASHSANLFTLVRDGYASMSNLSCPGNDHAPTHIDSAHQDDWSSLEEVSYSYQIFRGSPPRLSQNRHMVILADKSPVIPRARLGEPFDPDARSLNHSGRGQNILMSDLRVVFTKEPYKPGTRDNIWLPRHYEVGRPVALDGTEMPADEVDAFVGP